MDNKENVKMALELKNTIKGRKVHRERLLREFYKEYIENINKCLTIDIVDDNTNRIKNFYYLLDKGYIKITTALSNRNTVEFRLTAEGIDYIENLDLSEMDEYLNEEKEKDGTNNYDLKPLVN